MRKKIEITARIKATGQVRKMVHEFDSKELSSVMAEVFEALKDERAQSVAEYKVRITKA